MFRHFHVVIREFTTNALLSYICFNLKKYVTEQGGTLLVAQLVEALRYKPEGRGFDS